MAKKVYAVKVGRVPGLYSTWEECKRQVMGFSGAVYKGFEKKEEAEQFLAGEVQKLGEKAEVTAYVDGSFSKEIKRYSYGCILMTKEETVELSGAGDDPDYLSMNNVAGEILGSTRAVEWAMEHGYSSIQVYHDYEGIAKWANGEWKANKTGTQEYRDFIRESREKIQIGFTKVAAHTGVELNERADQLAKEALLS